MYHGISSGNCFKINGRHLPAKEFEKHLQYYQKQFSILPLSELFRLKRENIIHKRPTIALTFDDGYSNNLEVALPLLEKYKMPATFFINTFPLDSPGAIHGCDLLEIGCAFTNTKEVELGGITFRNAGKYRWNSETGQDIYDFFRQHKPEEKTRLINEWKERYAINKHLATLNKECFTLMNGKQIKQVAQSPLIEIGSHIHSHHLLTLLTDTELTYELQHSKSVLENLTGREIESIAFPDGYYNDRVIEYCHKTGYKNLVAVGLNKDGDKNIPDLVPRVGTANTDGLAFNALRINFLLKKYGF